MTVPGIVQLLQSIFYNLIYVDILITDAWIPRIFYGMQYTTVDCEALNPFIDENGYNSLVVLRNLGSTLVFIVMYLGLWGVIGITRMIAKRHER